MVQTAIQHLEDDEHLNAGYGSNLTLEGTVECDAAIMHGTTGLFGSVGAVSGVCLCFCSLFPVSPPFGRVLVSISSELINRD